MIDDRAPPEYYTILFVGSLTCVSETDVEHFNDLVETNINNYSPPDFLVNQIDLIYGFKSFANAGDAIANEAKVVKKFINKHFTFSFHP